MCNHRKTIKSERKRSSIQRLHFSNRMDLEAGLNNGLSLAAIAQQAHLPSCSVEQEMRAYRTAFFERSGMASHQNAYSCPLLQSAPYVCNGCPYLQTCRDHKLLYFGSAAHILLHLEQTKERKRRTRDQ